MDTDFRFPSQSPSHKEALLPTDDFSRAWVCDYGLRSRRQSLSRLSMLSSRLTKSQRMKDNSSAFFACYLLFHLGDDMNIWQVDWIWRLALPPREVFHSFYECVLESRLWPMIFGCISCNIICETKTTTDCLNKKALSSRKSRLPFDVNQRSLPRFSLFVFAVFVLSCQPISYYYGGEVQDILS